MHKPSSARVYQALTPSSTATPTKAPKESACPYTPPTASGTTPSTTGRSSPDSTYAALNPLNYMPSNLSQHRESAAQTIDLPTEREISTIPRGAPSPYEADDESAGGNWVYPSPQQMYNAMVRKGHTDTPADAVESMVAVHNFLNEGAWAEIVEWERRFAPGLAHGWRESARGEAGSHGGAMILAAENTTDDQPRLLRFMGQADKMTPKAYMAQVAGWIYPSAFAGPAPFDRHDWFVERVGKSGVRREKRYVIDYYSAPPEETGEPVFYLDIRPALDGPEAAAERLIRWSRDVWWRGTGGEARLREEMRRRRS